MHRLTYIVSCGIFAPQQANAGTPAYMAPELLELGKPFSSKVDVYAFGVMLNEMIGRCPPWAEATALDVKRQVCCLVDSTAWSIASSYQHPCCQVAALDMTPSSLHSMLISTWVVSRLPSWAYRHGFPVCRYWLVSGRHSTYPALKHCRI